MLYRKEREAQYEEQLHFPSRLNIGLVVVPAYILILKQLSSTRKKSLNEKEKMKRDGELERSNPKINSKLLLI